MCVAISGYMYYLVLQLVLEARVGGLDTSTQVFIHFIPEPTRFMKSFK